jgi:hypothetical protein
MTILTAMATFLSLQASNRRSGLPLSMLAVTLVAKDGQRREIQRTFERKRFPWENNPAGRDRIVIPPFTPLQCDEARRTVSCVLRRHELGNAGLWNQVTSQGRPLLAAPMRLEIEAAGKTNLAQEGELNFLEQAADRVRGRAAWTAGPVKGQTEFEFDYDGMAKITLHLAAADAQVDRMQLVIPMGANEASLIASAGLLGISWIWAAQAAVPSSNSKNRMYKPWPMHHVCRDFLIANSLNAADGGWRWLRRLLGH